MLRKSIKTAFFLTFGFFSVIIATEVSGKNLLRESENERVFGVLCGADAVYWFFKRATQLMIAKFLTVMLAVAFIAAGLPSVANAAFYDGTDTLISGQASFFDPSVQLYGYVDYAVYSPGNFAGSDSFPDKFFYCYQIFDSPTSSSIGRFTVNLNSGETAYSPDDFVFSAGDISPVSEFTNSNIVAYLFNSESQITPGNNSSVLFFAADSGTATDSVIITGAIAGSVTVQIPVPTPEPASLILLMLASPFLLKTRRNK